MKSSRVLLGLWSAGLLGCAAPMPEPCHLDKSYMSNKNRSIAVLDVYVDGPGVDAAVFQMRLSHRLQALGWSRARVEAIRGATTAWRPEDAAETAKAKGAQAALVCVVRIAPPERHEDPRADESTYANPSDPTGNRREYYRKDEAYGATDRGPVVKVEVSVVDAKDRQLYYTAEYRTHLKDAEEESLAEILLRPLKEID